MKTVIFKKISIKNFLSVGNDPVDVSFKTGLNIITGSNKDKEDRRNGVGKSTIADAIYFAVFGNTLREIKKENISNNCVKGSCEVILDFTVSTPDSTDEVRIIRTLEPSKAILHINGIDKTLDSIANTTVFISKILNCNTEVFENCVIMTINNTLPFMGKKKQDKRKFIESIFNLEIFSKMLSHAKEMHSTSKHDYDLLSGKEEEVVSVLANLRTQQATFAIGKETKIRNLKQKRDAVSLDKLKATSSIENIEKTDLVKVRDLYTDKVVQLEKEKINTSQCLAGVSQTAAEHLARQGLLQSSLNKIEANNSTCPVCLRDVSDLDRDHINKEKNRLQSDVDECVKVLLRVKSEKTELNTQSKKIEDGISESRLGIKNTELLERELSNLKVKVEGYDKDINTIEEGIADAVSETKCFDDIIVQQDAKLADVIKQVSATRTKLDTLDKVKFVFSEEGVKSFLVKRILDVFNSRLDYYLKKMDSNCTCTFNEYFEEVIIDDKGKPSSYYNFSGAERKNIDLACLFTFMDIRRLQGDTTFNFSLYDELFDSSLDEKGVDLVTSILRERIEKYNECVFVISHRKESIKFATGDVIFLEKNNGVTRRVDFAPASI